MGKKNSEQNKSHTNILNKEKIHLVVEIDIPSSGLFFPNLAIYKNFALEQPIVSVK